MRQETRRIERAAIVEALEETEGNRTRAAEILGITRQTLINKLKGYDLHPDPDVVEVGRDETSTTRA